MTGRNLHQEWIGKHPNAAIPVKVKLRVLDSQRPTARFLDSETHEWIDLPICPICGIPIRPGDGCDFDHKTPLSDGGEHREANLRALHRRCHRLLTGRQALERAEARAKISSAYGLRPRSKWPRRGFTPAQPQHRASTPHNKQIGQFGDSDA